MPPLVSILIPCYNCELWLAEALESALAQSWKNIEVIVVDDGSTDSSLAIAKTFESHDVKVICQPNLGASAARNKALKEAKGDFIQYLDADDILAPNKIELQLGLFETIGSDYVVAGEWARFYKTPQESQFIPQPLWADMTPIDWLTCSYEGHWMMHPAAWLVSRSISEQAGPWNESLSLNDDGEYFSRVILRSKGVKFCWDARTYYRSGNSNSLSGSKSYPALKSAFLSLELETSNLLDKEDNSRIRQVCATVLQRFIYEVYPDAPDLLQKAEAKVQEFGGSNIQPLGGPVFQFLASYIGWKKAKKIQKIFYQYGYIQLRSKAKIANG